MIRTKSHVFEAGLLSASALATSVAPALAQDESDRVETDDVIVVTVERRAQSLQDLAGTAVAVSADELRELGIRSVEDLDGDIPGLQIANNQGNVEIYIRGIGSSNNTELGDPAAATHINGVYVPRPSGIGAGFFDIERVEVNIGPQGTLRGRNATSGSVNIISFEPGIGIREFMLEASYGNYQEYRVEGMANLPVTENSALRLAGFVLEHDSYMESVTPNAAELGLNVPTSEAQGVGVAEGAVDFGFRASYKIEPTDTLRATLTYDWLSQQGTGYTGVNYANALGNGIDPNTIDEPRKVFGRAFTPEEDTVHWGIKGQVDWETPYFNIEYIGSYRDLVYDYEFVTPVSVAYPGALDNLSPADFDNFSRVRFITDSESIVQELRFYSNDDESPLYWTAGVFYFEEDQRTFLGTTGDRNPFFTGVEFNQTTATESLAFYADATYSVTEKFRLTGGVRYSEDKKERFGVNARYQFIIGGENFSCCFGTGVGTEGFEFNGLDRTIFNPDTNGDGTLVDDEILAFYFDGVKTFGIRDGLDDIYGNGVVLGDAPPEDHPVCEGFVFTGSCGNTFVPEIDGRIPFAVIGGTNIALQNGSLENDFIDWRVRAEYDITDDNLVYALVATGNKSGGFNDNIAETEGLGGASPAGSAPAAFDTDTLAPTYDVETNTLFEIGTKNQFEIGDIGVTLNASVFYNDWKDLQLTTLTSTAQILEFEGVDTSDLTQDELDSLGGNVVSFTFNASDAEVYGAQFDGKLRFPGNVNFDATLLFLQTEITGSDEIQDSRFQADVDPVNSVNRSIEGNELPRAPDLQFNGSLSKLWELPTGTFDAVISAGYRSDTFMTIFNGEDFSNPSDPEPRLNDVVEGYWLGDAGIGYSHGFDDRLRFEAYVNNFTGKEIEQAIIITQFDNTRFFNRPRTYGVRVRAKF
ncbi:MAG: TonB-dependent receptor [Pseudomonadota bacterium]